jgi:glycosyltransferase involved in cell wall biosynthesis
MLRALDLELGRCGAELSRVSFEVLAPPNTSQMPTLNRIPIRRVGHLWGHAWEQLELPWHARNGWLLNLANTGPIITRRQVVTIHDASAFAVPEAYSWIFRRWYQLLLPLLARVARRVVTDSDFSMRELIRYAGVPREKLRTVPLSGEHIRASEADSRVLRRLGLRPHSYVLTVGSQSPHKNLGVVVQAIEQMGTRDFDVVIAGGTNPRVFRPSQTSPGLGFKLLGYASDGELRALYENAGCFIYPSLYEGFGLPPLEAMTCGCPVIVSRAASLPEVCGSAALYTDATDASSVGSSILEVMQHPEVQQRLRSLGTLRAAHFTWARSAASLMLVLLEAMAE